MFPVLEEIAIGGVTGDAADIEQKYVFWWNTRLDGTRPEEWIGNCRCERNFGTRILQLIRQFCEQIIN